MSIPIQVQGQWSFSPPSKIYTRDPQRIIKTDDIGDPLRDGTYAAIQWKNGWENANESVLWVINIGQIFSAQDAQSQTIQLIQNIINYALGFLSFIAFVYLLYAGFQMVTAAGDESKFEKWQTSLKYATYAIIGIWISRIIIRSILIVIDTIL